MLSGINKSVCKRTLAAISLWLVAACAFQPSGRPTEANGVASAFSRPAAIDVFTTGYANITEKSLRKVPLPKLALDGMRGISSIDPSLTVRRTNDVIVLSSSNGTVAQFQAPADDDVGGWSSLIADLSIAGRAVSKNMRTAGAEDIYQAVFDRSLSDLDVFSHYAGAVEAKRNRAKRDGFGGIGISFTISGKRPLITRVLAGTPAFDSGLKQSDIITRIDYSDTLGLSKGDITSKLRGPIDSTVRITIRRGAKTRHLNFDIERVLIVPTTITYNYGHGVAFIKISNFNIHTARDLAAKLRKARYDHAGSLKGVVLDLRGNPGGLLKQSILVAGMFLTQGPIITTRGRHPDSLQSYEASGSDLIHGLPLIVIVDGKSASAAEVVASALQDRGRAVIVGTSSFGKGTVQTVIRLPNEGEITLTWSRLIPPSGYVLHGLGVLPAICSSGAAGNYMSVVRAALKNRRKAISIMEAWRTTSMENKARRKSLRASCPAEKRGNTFEVELSRRLINNNNLFRRALNLFPAPSTAQF